MFRFRRNLSGDAVIPTNDYKMDAAYAGTAKLGDVVKLNAAGDVVAAAADDVLVLGVYVGKNIKMEKDTTTTCKVMSGKGLVFEATKAGAPAAVVGAQYNLSLTAGDYVVDTSKTTAKLVEVVALRTNGNVDVKFIALQVGA